MVPREIVRYILTFNTLFCLKKIKKMLLYYPCIPFYCSPEAFRVVLPITIFKSYYIYIFYPTFAIKIIKCNNEVVESYTLQRASNKWFKHK